MTKILEVLENFYGGYFSTKAFSMNYILSLFYTLILFILLWSLGGSGKIGEIDIFPENIVEWKRLVTLLVLGIVGFIVYKVITRGESYNDKIYDFIEMRTTRLYFYFDQSEYLFKAGFRFIVPYTKYMFKTLVAAGLGFIIFYYLKTSLLFSIFLSVIFFGSPLLGK